MKNNIVNPDQEQVMIDLVTLSTENNAAIVSIGATKFSLSKGITDKFTINVDPFSCKNAGLHIDLETINWWKDQPKEASDAWKINPKSLHDALQAFTKWYGTKSLPTWSNGSDFDCKILKSAYNSINLNAPWYFYDPACFRTLSKLFPDVPFVKSGVAHNSLDDAISQTNHLIKILG